MLNIKLLQEYLKENREEYGKIGIGVSPSKTIYGDITVYGLFEDKLIISDSNSIYILKEKNKLETLLKLPFLRNSLNIGNSKTWYHDIQSYTSSKVAIKSPSSNEVLTKEQLKFYKAFIEEERQEFYDYHEQILIGKSKENEAYVYTKKYFK